MIKYLDPYKDIKYARLKGEKNEVFFKVDFDEAKFVGTNDGLILMGQVSKFTGVIRAFKPEEPLDGGICAIPIYQHKYEEWEKDKTGKASPKKFEPSLWEQNLVSYLSFDVDLDKHYKGSIAFLPDDQLTNLSGKEVNELLSKNCHLEEVEATNTLPEYQEFTSSYKKNGYNRLTPSDKLIFVKKELCNSIDDSGYNEEMSLADIIEQFIKEREVQGETFLALYFDLVKAILV